MENKTTMLLRKAELQWFLTFPDCPIEDAINYERELSLINSFPFSSSRFVTIERRYKENGRS